MAMTEAAPVGLFVDTEGRGPSIHTHGGGRFYVLDPRPEDVDLEDIGESLSKLCRFNGHTRNFYSVAEHSRLVSNVLYRWTRDSRLALLGLLHDAAEAYMGDVTRPLKVALEEVAPKVLRDIEVNIQDAILLHFDLDPLRIPREAHGLIKEADNVVLGSEMRGLLNPSRTETGRWGHDLPPNEPGIWPRGQAPHVAMADFISTFEDLWGDLGRSMDDI